MITLGLVAALVLAFWEKRNDPVIEGKRMSEWAYALVNWNGSHSGYDRSWRKLFATNRTTAIPHLISVTQAEWIEWRKFRLSLSKRLPGDLGIRVKPKALPSARWRAIDVLSQLAKKEPDPRIPRFFLECMSHPSEPVRKLAAYEAGPWLDPGDPTLAMRILERGLGDEKPAVRRDACRRLHYSGGGTNAAYTRAAERLLPRLRELAEDTKHWEVSSNAVKAVHALTLN